jgi:hypothetical protein
MRCTVTPSSIRFLQRFSLNDVFSAAGVGLAGTCAPQTGKNGNLESDPQFVDPSNHNFQLSSGSPAIDAGTNAPPHPRLPRLDLAGNPRIVDGGDCDGDAIVDMGAYEFQCAPGGLHWDWPTFPE